MSAPHFIEHTLESAPSASQRFMRATIAHLGYLPRPVARLAASPHLLEGFLTVSKLFDAASLDPISREVVVMTMATRNHCHVCVAMHSARLTALGAPAEIVTALRASAPLEDARLDAVRVFSLDVLATAGAVDAPAVRAFLDAGYTEQHALEVVLGIGTYTMSTLANRLTAAPLDSQLDDFAWAPG